MTTPSIEAEIDAINAPFWDGLKKSELRLQRCENGHTWLPARALCPTCLSGTWKWQAAAGTGRIVSWVVFHHAYHPDFKARLPYNVTLVQLDEGPRLLTNVLAAEALLKADRVVRLAVDTAAARPLATFRLMPDEDS